MDPEEFAAVMEAWAPKLAAYPDSPALGMHVEEFAKILVPTLVFRGSPTDFWHHRSTTEWVAELIRDSRLVEPPWGDNEWNERGDAAREGTGALFERWPLLAPQLLDFAARRGGAPRTPEATAAAEQELEYPADETNEG